MNAEGKILAPFPWFGGKRRAANIIWPRFGSVSAYVEPFFGSGAVLLNRPTPFHGYEIVNDIDGFVVNFWRSIKLSPTETAHWAEYPVTESDLHARHAWMLQRSATLTEQLEGNPGFHDPQIAGWWVWAVSIWLAGGFLTGDGPWKINKEQLLRRDKAPGGIRRIMPNIATHQGVKRLTLPPLPQYFNALAQRLENTTILAGDWKRPLSNALFVNSTATAIFLDPPYAHERRDKNIYRFDSNQTHKDVQNWCVENGHDKRLRIALCGYADEHDILLKHGWTSQNWIASNGRAKAQNKNHTTENIWFSPHCLHPENSLFATLNTNG